MPSCIVTVHRDINLSAPLPIPILIQAMSSESPLAPKPKSAVPSYLLNGTSQSSRPSRKRERENLTSSIKSTYGRRLAANLENAEENPSVKRLKEHVTGENDSGTNGDKEDGKENLLRMPARHPRDEAPITTSRPAGPYTLQPPVDYDGLSWPSIFGFL